MISYKTAMVVSAVIALASAWSTQFPQFYHAFPTPNSPPPPQPPPPPPLPSPFRSFFPEPPSSHQQLQSRFYQPAAPQFYRPPLQFYQPPPPPPPPPPPVATTRLRPTALALPTSSTVPMITTAADVHHHHHHHVFYYYYYLPVDGGEMPSTNGRARVGGGVDGPGQSAWRPCGGDNRPEVTSPTGCTPMPPAYLPPAPPSPSPSPPTPTAPPPPPPQPPTTTTLRPPCDDDTVVVDNVDYYPFGRAPIVVTAATVSGGNVDPEVPRNHRPETKTNFILANYLLPPDK